MAAGRDRDQAANSSPAAPLQEVVLQTAVPVAALAGRDSRRNKSLPRRRVALKAAVDLATAC